jgi:hypothetical protein
MINFASSHVRFPVREMWLRPVFAMQYLFFYKEIFGLSFEQPIMVAVTSQFVYTIET